MKDSKSKTPAGSKKDSMPANKKDKTAPKSKGKNC